MKMVTQSLCWYGTEDPVRSSTADRMDTDRKSWCYPDHQLEGTVRLTQGIGTCTARRDMRFEEASWRRHF